MKILHILNDLNFSGAEKMLHDASEHFKNEHFETSILSLVRRGGDGFEVHLVSKGYKVHKIKFSKSVSFFVELRKFLFVNNYDIVHIHTEAAFFWIALICKIAGVRKICRTIHSNFHFERFLKFNRKFQRYIARRLLKVKFISISESVYSNELMRFKNKTKLINNFVDTDHFNIRKIKEFQNSDLKAKLKIKDSSLIITTIGACSKVKNHKVIFDLVKKLIQENIDVVYLHIGTGYLEDDEINYSKTLGIYQVVRFIGNTMKTRQYLNITDIYLMPSEYEGVGLACLEAMSMNCLVMVHDAPGLNQLVCNNLNGLLVAKNDLETYVLEIKKFLYNKEAYKNMTSNAGAYVQENYSMKKSMESYFNFYYGL